VRERRAEDEGAGRAGRDAAAGEVPGDALGERRVGQTGLRGEDAVVQPFQELPAAVGVGRVGLREVDVGVHEAGQDEAAPVVRHREGRECGREKCEVADPGDRAGGIRGQGAVGQRCEVAARRIDGGGAGNVEDVAAVDLGGTGAASWEHAFSCSSPGR